MKVPKKFCVVAQITFFSKVMVLFAVPDVQDASSNVSQPNTSSACKLFFGVWHTRIVVQQGLLCAATLSIF